MLDTPPGFTVSEAATAWKPPTGLVMPTARPTVKPLTGFSVPETAPGEEMPPGFNAHGGTVVKSSPPGFATPDSKAALQPLHGVHPDCSKPELNPKVPGGEEETQDIVKDDHEVRTNLCKTFLFSKYCFSFLSV